VPINDYKCSKCGHTFEVFKHSYKEVQAVEQCPRCKSNGEKLLSKALLNFVGEGFYVNDYKKKTD